MTQIMRKYLDNSNKRLASLNKKYGIKSPCMQQTCSIHGLFMFLYLIFINHKLKKKSD